MRMRTRRQNWRGLLFGIQGKRGGGERQGGIGVGCFYFFKLIFFFFNFFLNFFVKVMYDNFWVKRMERRRDEWGREGFYFILLSFPLFSFFTPFLSFSPKLFQLQQKKVFSALIVGVFGLGLVPVTLLLGVPAGVLKVTFTFLLLLLLLFCCWIVICCIVLLSF